MGKGYTGTSGTLDGTWVEINVNSVSGDAAVLRSAATASAGSREASA
jgi:hypothetical protein